MMQHLRQIWQKNEFHGRIVLFILYFERVSYIKLPFSILRKIIVQMLYHCEIHPNSFVSDDAICSLRLPHSFMIIIHKTARISRSCTIFHNVTIGVVERDSTEFVPKAATLSEGVYIGSGSIVLGDLHIGANAKIGAMTIVLTDVPSGQTVTQLHKKR